MKPIVDYKHKIVSAVLSCILCLSLAACGNSTAPDPTGSKQTSQTETKQEARTTADGKESTGDQKNSDQNRTLADAMGNQVNIPAKPQRIIASYLEDNLLALGVKPVAQWSLNDGATKLGYLQKELEGIPTIGYDLPFEAVQSFKPDLVLIESAAGVEGDKYKQYSKIAPTFVVSKDINSDWRQEFQTIAKVLDKTSEADKVLAAYETQAQTLKGKISAKGSIPSAAAIWLVGGNFFVVNKNVSSGAVMYQDLGLKVPAVVEEISAKSKDNWNAISLEKLTEMDADYLFLVNSMEGKPAVLSDALWNIIPAVQNNRFFTFDQDTAWLYSGPIANKQILAAIEASLLK